LGSQDIPRLRIGIGVPPPERDVTGFVLSRFTAEELPEIQTALDQAAQGAAAWVEHGIAHCMNQYNA
jgi:PTH1 family peptidyl-tRNA hydrolase